MKKKLYKSIFSFATLQFDGHYLQHLIENSEKLVAVYLLPRGGGVRNFIEEYRNGVIVRRQDLISPKNVVTAYICYYFDYLYTLIKYFSVGERFYLINFFPFLFFGRSIIRIFWKIQYVYWIGDYWPMKSVHTNVLRFLMHFYHDRTKYTFYLSDRINKVMNYGKMKKTAVKRTVMWGINPPRMNAHKSITGNLTLCFIGVLAQWQGIDLLLEVISKRKNLRLKIIGTGKPELVKQYKDSIKRYGIGDRVYFPNSFYYGRDLYGLVKDCHIGIALYKTDPNTVTYFSDPAKIKQYAEFGLPVIMTDASGIAAYIERFNAGIVVTRDVAAVVAAIQKIQVHYERYLEGLNALNHYFDFRRYYGRAFQIMRQ